MRFLCEVFVVAVLIYLGWETPFSEWVGYKHEDPALKQGATATHAAAPAVTTVPIAPVAPPMPVVVASPTPAPTRAGSWMFDPSHRSPLDREKTSPHP
jgi:hypothetical protein